MTQSPFRQRPAVPQQGRGADTSGSQSGPPVSPAGSHPLPQPAYSPLTAEGCPDAVVLDEAGALPERDGWVSREQGLVLNEAAAPAALLRPRRPVPDSGMRRLVHALTGGLVNMGPSPAQTRERDRLRRIQRPLRGAHVTTYSVVKGGTGKTSTAVGVSMTAAEHRPEAVVLGDFNPDAGDAAERVLGTAGLAGVNRLAMAAEAERIHSIGELSQFLRTQGRLTMLPGEPEPRAGESLSSHQFNAVIEVLARYYASIHVDTGTGITHPVMPGILARTDTLVVPAAYSITGARRAVETLEWLSKNGFGRLADSAIVALTAKDDVSADVDKAAVRAMFRGVDLVVVPKDSHLADGAMVQLGQLQPQTREAFAEIAALVADRYRS